MNLSQFKAYVKEKALAVSGVNTFLHDWIHVINDAPENEYDLLLMTPPKENTPKEVKEWAKQYECQFYLFAKNENQGQELTPDQRDEKWSELQGKMNQFFNDLFVDRTKMILINSTPIEFDDTHIGIDAPVWVKATATIRATKPC